MKVFDKDEQAIIRKITQGRGYYRTLINILDRRNNLEGTRVRIDKTNKKAEFLFQILNEEPTDEEAKWGIKKQEQLIELLIKHVTLFRYLEKEELAIFFDSAKETEQTITFGMGAVNMPSFSMSIDDQNVIDLLIKYVHKEIMPSPSLRKIENNKFVSDEEIKFRKQHVATWAAILVSILLGLYGMYNNHRNSVNQEKQFDKQIIEYNKMSESIKEEINEFRKSRIDYSRSIASISEELSKLTDKVELIPKNQSIEIKFPNEGKVLKK